MSAIIHTKQQEIKMSDRAAGVATATTYTASGSVTLFGAFSINEIALIGGLLLGAGTFIVNWFYQHKRYKLMESEYFDRRTTERRES